MAENSSLILKTVTFKVVFAGKYGVGKTSLFRRIFNMGFDGANATPSGIDNKTYKKSFPEDNITIELKIWDTAEMERHGSITQSYYKGSHFALLVYSANDETSLGELECISNYVQSHEARAKLFVVRNKTDLPIEKDGVSLESQQKFFCAFRHKIHGVFSTSAKENTGVKELLEQLTNYALLLSKGRSIPEKKADEFDGYIRGEPDRPSPSCCS